MTTMYVVERDGEYYSECNDWTTNPYEADLFEDEYEAQCVADNLTMSWGTRYKVEGVQCEH